MKSLARAVLYLLIEELVSLYEKFDPPMALAPVEYPKESPLHPESAPILADYKNSEDGCMVYNIPGELLKEIKYLQ